MKKVWNILLNPLVFSFLLVILIGGIVWATAGEKWAIFGLVGIPLGLLLRKYVIKK